MLVEITACAHRAGVGGFVVAASAPAAENQSGWDMEKSFFHFDRFCGGRGIIHIARNVSGAGENCQKQAEVFLNAALCWAALVFLCSWAVLGWMCVSRMVLPAQFQRTDCFVWHGTRYVRQNVRMQAFQLDMGTTRHGELLSSVWWEASSLKGLGFSCLLQWIPSSLKSVLWELEKRLPHKSLLSPPAPLEPHQ